MNAFQAPQRARRCSEYLGQRSEHNSRSPCPPGVYFPDVRRQTPARRPMIQAAQGEEGNGSDTSYTPAFSHLKGSQLACPNLKQAVLFIPYLLGCTPA